MTQELQTQRDILAERQAEEFVHIHTLSNLYAKQSFIEGFDACHTLMNKDIEALQAKLDVAKKALEFYADRNNWKNWDTHSDVKDVITVSDLSCKSMNEDKDFAIPSGGRRARQALKEMETTSKGEK